MRRGETQVTVEGSPSSVSAFGRSTFSHEWRRELVAKPGPVFLLPSWEKVAAGG
jgi:hypothetical protein